MKSLFSFFNNLWRFIVKHISSATMALGGVVCNAAVLAQSLDLKLPYSAGESFVVVRAYNNQTHVGKDRYALDFAQNGCKAWGKNVLAVAKGRVIRAVSGRKRNIEKPNYGNVVIIQHANGYTSIYAHLKDVLVQKEQFVHQGEVVGTVGNSGYTFGKSCGEHVGVHLHYVLRKDNSAALSEPMDGYTHFTVGKWYKSTNRVPPTISITDICPAQSCDISTQTFSTGEIVGWYPKGDCMAAQKWFTLTEKDGVLTPQFTVKDYYPCQCK